MDRSSLIGEAVLYTLNQEVYLKRYLEDGHLSIDNLAAERALKNFAIGRRNWLFAKSIRGAQASATVYSITETAMLNGLKPYNYLTCVMEKMKVFGPFPEKEAMLELLPWSSSLPADCHSKLKNKRRFSLGKRQGISYFVKVRMITYLHRYVSSPNHMPTRAGFI